MKIFSFLFWMPFFIILCLIPRTSYASNSIDYVILTNKTLAPAFTNLAIYKNSQGIKTSVFCIENIPNYPGVTLLQEKIRKYIINLHLQYSFRYLLIGGDFNAVPPSFNYPSYNLSAANNFTVTVPTDAYYGLLSPTNLPYNGGALGLPKVLSFDLVVGRAPVSTIQQASAFVNKTIAYSNNFHTLRLNRNAIIGEMLTPYPVPNGTPPSQIDFASTYLTYDVGNGLGSVVSNTPFNDTFFESVKCTGYNCGIHLFNPQQEATNVGPTPQGPRHVAIYYGHDNSYLTMKHLLPLPSNSLLLPAEKTGIANGILVEDVTAIINNSSPDFIFNMGCSTAAYDHQDPVRSAALKLTNQQNALMLTIPSIGEDFILNSRTVAYIGNSRQGIGSTIYSTNPSAILLNKLVYMTFRVPINRTLGDALTTAKESYANENNRLSPVRKGNSWDDAMLSEFYNVNLLGDPTNPL